MAGIKKKGTAGQARNFITRTQAVRKLQISLADFRRLCIFKGIYPREPRNKKKVSRSSTPATTFYYTKDIQFLLHEPLLSRFREQKALSKKIQRSLGRNEIGDAARIEKNGFKKLSLDHLVKERYPTFVDALRDLDDALSLLFLFANLPSTVNTSSRDVALCRRLCLEFQHYIITTHSLRKSFLSIKGIYYQATIQGQDILWLVPYNFVQRVTGDVDFRIMSTFVEFYTTLLGFVNFRLYTSIGLVYPPKFDARRDEQGGELGILTLEGKSIEESDRDKPARLEPGGSNGALVNVDRNLQRRVDEISIPDDSAEQATAEVGPVSLINGTRHGPEAIDRFEIVGAGGDVLLQPRASNGDMPGLFAPFTFFISREAPRQPLEFILRAFGCKRIGWDEIQGDGAYTNDEKNPSITHQVVDRPLQPVSNGVEEARPSRTAISPHQSQKLPPGSRMTGRTYIQPQWVWDCINEGKLLRPDLYVPGATLPPHLSPWVKPKGDMYDPTVPLEEQEREGEADEFAEEEAEAAALEAHEARQAESDEADNEPLNDKPEWDDGGSDGSLDDHGMRVANSDDPEGSEDADEGAPSHGFDGDHMASAPSESDLVDQGDSHQAELEAEAAGKEQVNGIKERGNGQRQTTAQGAKKMRQLQKRKEEEELRRRMGMMTGKKRKQLERMMHGQTKRDAEAEMLRRKRRKIESDKGKSSTSK